MLVVMVMLTGVIMAGLITGAFALGYYIGTKQKPEEGVALTENNRDMITEMASWLNYNGGRK